MDYDYIEKLAAAAKQGDEVSKEALASEFTPLILRLSNKSLINICYSCNHIFIKGNRCI